MGYGTDIQAKLGVDTSSVGTDLAGAKNTFNKWGEEIASSGEAHGANFGGKLVGGIEHKVLGARHLSGAIASALGLNIEKISESIASAIVGGSKEGWGEALKIAEENAKLINKQIELSLTPKGLQDRLKRELEKAVEEANSVSKKNSDKTEYYKRQGLSAPQSLNDENLKEQEVADNKVLEINNRILEKKKENKEATKDLVEASEKEARAEQSLGHHYEEVHDAINATVLEILKGGLADDEVIKKKMHIIRLEAELREVSKAIHQADIEFAHQEDAAAAKKHAREEKLFSLQKQRFSETKKLQDDQNKLTDRSKLTVGELATLQGGKKDFSLGKSSLDLSFGSNEGLTADQVANKEKAQKVQQLEQEAEQKRLGGDVAGSETAFGKVGQLRDELVSSGGVKSTEGDKFGELRKQIAEDDKKMNHTLQEIKDVLAGKFVSQ